MKINQVILPLVEAKGLFGRKIGDTFVDDNDNKIQFQSIKMYPEKGAFPDIAACDAAKHEIEKQTGNKILWVNAHNAKYLAFAVATFAEPDGNIMLWGRHYVAAPNQVIGSWGNNETPGTWKLQTKTASKMRSGFTPQDLIASDGEFENQAAVLKQIQSRTNDPDILEGFNQLSTGNLPVFKNQADNFEAIRDYLGEIMQPLALMHGLVTGDTEMARKECLGVPFRKCKIVWPQGKNNNLIDSLLRAPSGQTLGISSKGDKGANASAANIYAAIVKAERSDKADLLETYSEMVEIIKTIQNHSTVEGPLILGVELNVCSEELAAEIRKLVKSDMNDVSKASQEAQKVFTWYGTKQDVAGWRLGNVLLTNVAKRVSDVINQKPNFGEGCLAFLNQSSIIQVYTQAKVVGKDVHITGFNCIFPPEFKGSVYLDAGKNYSSNVLRGKISFKYGPPKPS